MKRNARSARLASGLAAIAVTLAAVGAMADAWFDRREAGPALAASGEERPAADAPVSVVRAPEQAPVRRYPTACRECGTSPRVLEGTL